MKSAIPRNLFSVARHPPHPGFPPSAGGGYYDDPFDSRLIARFVFAEDDTTLGVVLSEDPAEVALACQVRDAAWHHATRTADFAKAVPSTG